MQKNQYLATNNIFKYKFFHRSKTSQCHTLFANYMRQFGILYKIFLLFLNFFYSILY